MPHKLFKIFKKTNGITIGAVHFPPLLGYADFPGFKKTLRNALQDIAAFEEGGIDGIILENNYDIPHTEFVSPASALSMSYLIEQIRARTKLPLGASVLWNDYRAALALVKIHNLQFIRVPVFVDTVKTACGVITGNARDVIKTRDACDAADVAILTDIHVKHSELLSKFSITESARRAIKAGSDGLIITGRWTGEQPDLSELARIRAAIGDFPIVTGSGTNAANVTDLFKFANGTIVSTALKAGSAKKTEINVKSYDQRISRAKVLEFTKIAHT